MVALLFAWGRLLFGRGPARHLDRVWDRNSVQLNFAGLGKAKFLARLDCQLLPLAMFFFQRGLIWQNIALGGGAAGNSPTLDLATSGPNRNQKIWRGNPPYLQAHNQAGLLLRLSYALVICPLRKQVNITRHIILVCNWLIAFFQVIAFQRERRESLIS